ncbi:putative encoded by [Lyophyllum shimeji]|uniref:Encoded by n=1 Tax=Lyophyllum shimeji TaxID=47721 RepID=A0A9P3PYX5_LYOSH|nr:putative encoded by [Lyophyllum shimeji]
MPEVEAPFQKTRPKTAFVGCRFCIDEWHVWSNTNPQTATIREHLISKHYDKFRVAVLTNKLKGWETFGHAPGARGKEREPFSLEGFYERFVRWIAVDDQSINVIDSPELRDLLLYVGTQLDEDDLPHRTKLTQLIYERFQLEFKKLIEELKNAAGRISFTSDLWTDQNRRSYMAITAHFMSFGINGQVTMTTRLVAFRYVPGSHSGQNLAKVFVAILKELGIFNRIGMVTLDNASNCGSMMEFVALLLRDMGVYFDKEGNRIRCFPHIINLAVKAGLKQLTKLLPRGSAQDQDDDGDDFECDDDPATQLDIEADDPYMEILRDDVVAAAHDLRMPQARSGTTIINPTVKFHWLEKNWTADECKAAKEAAMAALLEHCRALRRIGQLGECLHSSSPTSVSVPSASRAARAQISGLARLDDLERELSMESVTSPSSPTTDPVSPLSAEEKEAAELAEDKQAVQDEWDKYMADGVIEKREELDDFDLERF